MKKDGAQKRTVGRSGGRGSRQAGIPAEGTVGLHSARQAVDAVPTAQISLVLTYICFSPSKQVIFFLFILFDIHR